MTRKGDTQSPLLVAKRSLARHKTLYKKIQKRYEEDLEARAARIEWLEQEVQRLQELPHTDEDMSV